MRIAAGICHKMSKKSKKKIKSLVALVAFFTIFAASVATTSFGTVSYVMNRANQPASTLVSETFASITPASWPLRGLSALEGLSLFGGKR
jgi:hypothetical protein